jgi:acetyl-CoA carboxylase biotin carboxyl carrier protein
MTINFQELEKLIKLTTKYGVAEIEVSEGEKTIRVSNVKNVATTPIGAAPLVIEANATPQNIMQPVTSATNSEQKNQIPSNKHTVNAPMVGTVYLAPAPGAKHFVEVGQHVKVGDTLCLIEAMKMFNRIESDKGGVVTAIFVDNSQPVEYDQPLFVIE